MKALTNARLLVTTGADKTEVVDVAHEALIRGWPRLRGWIQADPSALRTQRRITEGAQEWDRLQRDEGTLFRGALLAVTQEWRRQHEQDLNALEREFLEASVALTVREEAQERQRQERERKHLKELAEEQRRRAEAERERAAEQQRRAEAEQQRAEEQRQRAEAERERTLAEQQRADTQASTAKRLRWGAAVLAGIMLLAAGAARVAWTQQQRTQALLAQNYWANGVNAKRQGDWLQAMHYFARSVRKGDAPAQLRNTLLNMQGYTKNTFLVSQISHDGGVRGASFNHDESLVLTWSYDNTARLWNIKVDADFPPAFFPLLVEVATGTRMDEVGNVTALTPAVWQARKQDYSKIAEQHLAACQFRDANLYVQQQKMWESFSAPTPTR